MVYGAVCVYVKVCVWGLYVCVKVCVWGLCVSLSCVYKAERTAFSAFRAALRASAAGFGGNGRDGVNCKKVTTQ